MGTASAPSVEQFVCDRADQLSATSTSLSVVADRGESFSSIASTPGIIKMCATELGRALRRYEHSRPAFAALKIADRDDAVKIPNDIELVYCEGFVSVHSRPRRRRWVAFDGYVVNVADEPLSATGEERHHRRARIEPPSSAQCFGVGIPAD